MKRLILYIISTVAFLFFGSHVAFGATCSPIYGGGPSCSVDGLHIQKEFIEPGSVLYVHDLGTTNTKFHANDNITFRITVSNNGSDLSDITIKDTFPSQLIFLDGPGKFDEINNVTNISLPKLKSNETKQFIFHTRVVGESLFPKDLFCVSNQVSASSPQSSTQDSTQLCIEKVSQKPTAQLTQTPATGPNEIALALLAPIGLFGFALRKLTQ